ncbi:hypothetical protein J2Z40_002930 [Cytobacillus eiseniae]|uniref:O-antigen ligase-related domain-containing protein n=1 Tax=Cytobacillus eiseniae TaxID=762947 RepID=A0ABS4RHJ6_9BACI|nr:O-antigen ligase family protein [Cytobacillus eiseniae]MBP2242356.1 hypothetical protein [Cytobacillus eiseniae]
MSKFDELFGERIEKNAQNSSNIVKVETESETEIRKIDRILTIGLLLIILIVPLVVRVHFSEFISPQITGTDMDSGPKSDIFTFYKFVILLIGTLILSLIFLYKVFFAGYTIPKSKLNIVTGLFAVMILLSAIFAPNKTLALFGMFNRHEGTLTYLCYIALFFIASNIKFTNKQLRWFIYILYPFVIINALLGLLSFFGFDILKYEFGKAILYSGLPEGSSLQEGSKFIATINHGNYVSGIAAVLIVLFLTSALLDEKLLRTQINLLFALITFALMLSSLSSSGFVTLLSIIPFIVLLIIKASNKKKFVLTGLTFLILSTGIFTIMSSHNSKVWDETFGIILSNNPFNQEDNKEMGSNFSLAHNVFAAEELEYNFPKLPESGVGAGSGRLYIWGETWELIKERPLLGYGLDTLPYHFPQNDPGKHSNIETYNVVVDKPHNMYVGVVYGSGIIAILVMLILIFNIFIKTVINLWKKQNKILAALFISTVAYVLQALFNDSLIGVTVIFWISLGVLLSVDNNTLEID